MPIFKIITQGETEHYSAIDERDFIKNYKEEYGTDVDLIESIVEVPLEETKNVIVFFEETGDKMTVFEYLGGKDQNYYELICTTNY